MNKLEKIFILYVLVLLAFLPACSGSSATQSLVVQATSKPAIQLEPCRLGDIPAQCGKLSVYENRATNTGRMIDIHMAVIKASGPNPAPDPIFYVAGGPGSSGINDAAYALLVLKSAHEHRDLVLFDQRGTGQSHRMACPRQDDEKLGLVPFDDKMLQDLQTCLEHLDGDPRAYTTAWGMDDLDDLRVALGYDQINLYGESYGPLAEQVYLQRHGNHVRTMTLEGVSLLDAHMFERMPRSSQEALDLLFARCQADPACNAAYPNLSDELKALIAQLEKQPVELSLINPYTGQPVRLTREWLVLGIHNVIRDTPTAVLLPGLIHQAYLGDWSAVEKLLSNDFAAPRPEWSIMNLVILCHEDWARTRREETTQFSSGSYMGYE
ncbi:MAG: alpha/beta hydrolase, partial [Anaerolineales bacterium]